jgi:hypothetical protein
MKNVFWAKKKLMSAVLVLVVALLLSALPADAKPSLVGEVTTDAGLPLSKDSIMQVADSAGHTKDLTLKAPGEYKVDTDTLTPPVWIKAGNLFAVSVTGNGVQEVTPLSYAILNQILQTQGTNAPAQFGTLSPIPVTSVQVQSVSSMFKDALQYPLSSFKVNFAKFDFNTTRFHFNSGFGKFLDNTTFSSGAGTATQIFQTTFGSGISQTSTFHAMVGGTWAQWMTTAGVATSGSFDYTKVPTSINAGRDYGNVGNFLKTQWFPTFKHEGKLLDSTNVLPLLDTNYLSNGFDRNTQASRYATDFRNLKFSPTFDLGVIRSYTIGSPDSSHNLIGVDYTFTKTDFGVKLPERMSEIFKCDSTGCTPYGNQQLGGTEVRIKWDTYSLKPSTLISFASLNTSFFTPKNTYASIRVSDFNNTFFNNSLMDGPFSETLNLQPMHGGPIVPFMKDEFRLFADVLPPPFVYSDYFTFNGMLNPSGSTPPYKRFAAGYTWENVNWRKPFLDDSHQPERLPFTGDRQRQVRPCADVSLVSL